MYLFRYVLISIRYIPEHLREMFLWWPRFRSSWPYFIPNVYAMSILFTTPAFILIVLADYRRRVIAAAWLAAIEIAIPILAHGGSGFTQFGYRYTLDFTPFLLLLTASGMRGNVRWWMIALIVVSIAVNLWGVIMLKFLNIWSW